MQASKAFKRLKHLCNVPQFKRLKAFNVFLFVEE